MTQNDFKMTLTSCVKHLVHLRTHLGSYWDSFWVLLIVSWAGTIPVHIQGLIVPAIITSEITQNDFQMTLTPCEKHFVHLRTHLGSYLDSFWLLLIVSWAGTIPVHVDWQALTQSTWTGIVPSIITSEMTQNDFKMTVTSCEKHLVHLRTHLGS